VNARTETKQLPTVGTLQIPIRIDENGQELVTLITANGNVAIKTLFKIDSGCNAVLMRRGSLQALGFDTSEAALNKLPDVGASLSDGSTAAFKQVGEIVLIHGQCRICAVPVICHATKNTRNLLGTSVLHKFNSYKISTRGRAFLELSSG
jgi:predicted aspartyl protease